MLANRVVGSQVPSRLNYVHWIQDLIDQTVPEPTADDHIDATAHSIIGLDMYVHSASRVVDAEVLD